MPEHAGELHPPPALHGVASAASVARFHAPLAAQWSLALPCPLPLPSPPPCLPAGGGPSQECLVTLVMKVDLGGWLSPASLLLRVGRAASEPVLRAWLEPMLLSVVMLRDKVGWRGVLSARVCRCVDAAACGGVGA